VGFAVQLQTIQALDVLQLHCKIPAAHPTRCIKLTYPLEALANNFSLFDDDVI